MADESGRSPRARPTGTAPTPGTRARSARAAARSPPAARRGSSPRRRRPAAASWRSGRRSAPCTALSGATLDQARAGRRPCRSRSTSPRRGGRRCRAGRRAPGSAARRARGRRCRRARTRRPRSACPSRAGSACARGTSPRACRGRPRRPPVSPGYGPPNDMPGARVVVAARRRRSRTARRTIEKSVEYVLPSTKTMWSGSTSRTAATSRSWNGPTTAPVGSPGSLSRL